MFLVSNNFVSPIWLVCHILKYFHLFLHLRKGHEITVVSPFKEQSDKYEIICSDPDGSLSNEMKDLPSKSSQPHKMFPALIKCGQTFNENALQDPKMQKYIQDPNTKFDIVIVQTQFAGEGGYYIGHRFNAPTATFHTIASQVPYVSHSVGQPYNPSFMKLPLMAVDGDMNILHRVANSLGYIMIKIFILKSFL